MLKLLVEKNAISSITKWLQTWISTIISDYNGKK